MPSTNPGYGDIYYHDDRSPLLDVSNNIEQSSDGWPVDPDNQSEIFSNMTLKKLHLLGYVNG